MICDYLISAAAYNNTYMHIHVCIVDITCRRAVTDDSHYYVCDSLLSLQTQHTFKHVFDENSSQREVFDAIGFPLVEDLLQGKNGLMFAYGITNSGKTYTVTGEPDQAGILPRSLDVIFNSIADVQAPKYVSQC